MYFYTFPHDYKDAIVACSVVPIASIRDVVSSSWFKLSIDGTNADLIDHNRKPSTQNVTIQYLILLKVTYDRIKQFPKWLLSYLIPFLLKQTFFRITYFACEWNIHIKENKTKTSANTLLVSFGIYLDHFIYSRKNKQHIFSEQNCDSIPKLLM